VDNSAGQGWEVNAVRSTDGGATFGQKFYVNDVTAGGQCKGWALFDCYGGLHVMYYSTLNWPPSATSRYSVRYRFSGDGGATFRPSTRLTDADWVSHADFMGEYHIMRSDSQYVYAVWTDGRNEHNDLYFSKAPLIAVNARRPLETPGIARIVKVTSMQSGGAVIMVSPAREPVEIRAFDASGRMVKVLHDGVVPSPVSLSVNPSSGLAIVRVHYRGATGTFRVIGIK
jgi:hypothetical protein